MNCMDIRQMLSLYMDNELNEEETKIVENHFKNCEACQNEYNELKQLRYMLGNLEDVSIPEEFDERLRNAIYNEIEKQKMDNTIEENEVGIHNKLNLKKKINYRRISSIVAIFVIGIFTVFLYNNSDALFSNNDELNMSKESNDEMYTEESNDEMYTRESNIQESANAEYFSTDQGKEFGLETINGSDSNKSDQEENTSASTENISNATTSIESEPLKMTEQDSLENSSTIAPRTLYKDSPALNSENQVTKPAIDSKIKDVDEKALYEELIQKELSGIEYRITKTEKQENNTWLFIIEIDCIDKDGNKAMEIRTYKGENGALSWIKD